MTWETQMVFPVAMVTRRLSFNSWEGQSNLKGPAGFGSWCGLPSCLEGVYSLLLDSPMVWGRALGLWVWGECLCVHTHIPACACQRWTSGVFCCSPSHGCVHVCVWVHGNVHALGFTHLSVHREPRGLTQRVFLYGFPTLFSETVSLREPGAHCFC